MKKTIGYIMYLISCIFIGKGFHKMFVYESSDLFPTLNKNTYVGGDAYNYIINANYATGFFILALIFAVVGSTFLIINILEDKNSKNIKDDIETENDTEDEEDYVTDEEIIAELNKE